MTTAAGPARSVQLELRSVRKTYPGEHQVEALASVSLQVAAGDFLSITGPSGSGKSTLLNVLGLLDSPSSGTYLVEGQPVADLGRGADRLRSRVFGFVFQAAHMIPRRTVAQNLEVAMALAGVPRRERAERTRAALLQVGLSRRGSALAKTLSGGERQRAAIARALITEPSVVLADEPTGNLDPRNSDAVVDLLSAANSAGTTVIVITHSEEVAAAAPIRYRMVDGRLAGRGSTEPLPAPG